MALKHQLPLNIKIKALKGQFPKIHTLLEYYPTRRPKIKPILIIDQINILFDNLRNKKYKNDKRSEDICRSF
jgi:hypothetical protein